MRTNIGYIPRLASSFPQDGGIFGNQLVSHSPAAAGGWLVDADLDPFRYQRTGNGGRHAGFADVGICSRDEQSEG